MNNEGEKFAFKLTDGTVRELVCTIWTCERRRFECKDGCIDIDWMEFDDQVGLGRIWWVPSNNEEYRGADYR